MPSLHASYPALREALLDRYGPPTAADPPDAPFARLVAAFLGRTMDGSKIHVALEALRDAAILEAEALAVADPAEIGEALRSRGLRLAPRTLAPLRRLAQWADKRGDLDGIEGDPTESLREEWRSINGVGAALADALLLHGLGRVAYPLDRATYRIFIRHGWLDPGVDYDEARAAVERLEPDDPGRLADLSAWFERVGAEACRPSVAKCERCPLRPFLPEGGPLGGSESD